jgi:hypothetical protein
MFLASLAWLKRDRSTSSRYIIAQWLHAMLTVLVVAILHKYKYVYNYL